MKTVRFIPRPIAVAAAVLLTLLCGRILDGKLPEALAQLEQFTQANAENADGWLLLGDVRRARGDAEGARAAYARAAQLAPDYARLARPKL